MQKWLVSCPKGLEQLLTRELTDLGAEVERETVAGVYCMADLRVAYGICLWSRLANRLLLQLGQFDCRDADGLYNAARHIDWRDHFDAGNTFAVRFHGSSREITHTQFGAQRVKDGVVDSFRDRGTERPDVDTKNPDIWLNAHLAKDKISLALDFAGDSLHRRRYRVAGVPAPLKENLAAALLLRGNWPDIAAQGGALIDPMCGSGTLLIEGALMVADIAPGLLREELSREEQSPKSGHGFAHWRGHSAQLWAQLLTEARQRRAAGLARDLPEIRGYDEDLRAIRACEENIQQAGLGDWVRVLKKPLHELKKPTHKPLVTGLVICNPPYGERLGDEEKLRGLYYQLGERLKAEFAGWQVAVFTGNPELGPEMNLRAHKQYKLFNGAMSARLLLFAIDSKPRAAAAHKPEALPEGARMFANRLQKNLRKLQPWLKREGIECYRLYDADMPEYAVAIDMYGDVVHMQEYDPPKTIDERAARRRLREARLGLLAALPIAEGKLFFKQRKRQKGRDQYRRRSGGEAGAVINVNEGAAVFEINLHDYLDTGLFLDHRPLRRMIYNEAKGKRVLNLFCYTVSITVQAALGGASQSLSIDMSQTYLDWARRNFALNKINTYHHQLLRADCVQWLDDEKNQQAQEFDLIVLDPPTFSNSKKMAGVLDIQRDHGKLIRQALRMLASGGTLYFSNNFRRFKMDGDILERLDVEELGGKSIDPDFERNPKIHNCWKIKRRET